MNESTLSAFASKLHGVGRRLNRLHEERVKKLKILPGFVLLIVIGVCPFGQVRGQTALINWTDVHQQIDGFGASSANIVALRTITDAQADLFFDPIKGIELSLLRTQIQPDGSSTEIVTTQKAVARGTRIWGSPWSPPAKYKTNRNLNNGGYLRHSSYGAWANVLTKYVQMIRCRPQA